MNRLTVAVYLALAVSTGFAQAERPSWTKSRIQGTPDPPPPYKVEAAFPELRFHHLTVLTNAPGTERLFVAEQAGKIYSFDNDPQCSQADLVADLRSLRRDFGSIYGLTFDPEFQDNRQVYICYVVGRGNDSDEQKEVGTRLCRFEMDRSDPPRLLLDTEELLLTWRMGGHNGGCLKFGPDGYLYVSAGDAGPASPPDPERVGQDLSNVLSAILRIDVSRTEEDRPYAIPADNPFVDLEGARPEIWAYGFRNPWKMSFDRQTGDLWVGDVGWELWEMVYRVERGGNYGWSVMEGRQVVHPEEEVGPTPILPPTIDHPHSEAASITGGFVYRGDRLPELAGAYIYGDFQSGIMWAAKFDGDKLLWKKEIARTPLQLVAFGEDNAGEVYLVDYQEQIFRLIENPAPDLSGNFPRKLSETGLFESVTQQSPAAGVYSYSINAHQWNDGANSERWLAVPGVEPIRIDRKGNWQFPDGSAIAKTVSLEVQDSDGEFRQRRLETQVLHREGGSWRPYSYAWNENQTDADLVDSSGFTRVLRVRDGTSRFPFREQQYRFAARSECLLCHNPWVEKKTTIFGVQSASPLAVNAHQLNRLHSHEAGSSDQLKEFRDIGLLAGSFNKDARFADPYDESADLNARARAYLHVNCSHCHQFNAGGAATVSLSHDVKLEEARAIDVRPAQGTFGISDAKIIAPGDPFGSVLLYRLSKLGGGRMPRMGANEVDRDGVRLIHDWISQLPHSTRTAPQPTGADAAATLRDAESNSARSTGIAQLTASTRGAQALLHLVDSGELADEVVEQVIEATKNHDVAEVRDLFERFVPPAERVQRLGTAVNHSEILALEADSERGQRVFFESSAAACKNCHRIRGRGQALGPDLDEIGKKYTRDQLLVHILDPSKFMEPKYVPYFLETTSGQVLSGLVESKTDQHVKLRDAQNKLHEVRANDVELLVRQQKSLMPELLLRDLTRDQVADLLAYLASLK